MDAQCERASLINAQERINHNRVIITDARHERARLVYAQN